MQNISTSEQFRHDMLVGSTHDEFARQEFVKSFKLHIATKVAPGNRTVYEQAVKPAFEKTHGRAPKDRHEVRKVLAKQDYYRFWSELLRTSQEMMWDSVGTPVERQLPDLIETAKKLDGTAGGTLRLAGEGFEIPRYHRSVDIHCQPGAYHTELTQDDVAAGAIYDRAVYLYAMGRMGPFNNDIGASVAKHVKATWPDLKPLRILDLGCSVGHSTTPYCDLYPEAEVHGIDVGAPMLRYAHARAESLGAKVHFSQQNAEKTDFPDGHFDLIVSHILLHETGSTAFRNILAECNRVLAPGGVMIHGEVPQYEGMDPFDACMLDWDTYNNNEPFWGTLHDKDLKALVKKAGFEASSYFEAFAPSAYEEAEHKRIHGWRGGDFGGSGQWFAFGARK